MTISMRLISPLGLPCAALLFFLGEWIWPATQARLWLDLPGLALLIGLLLAGILRIRRKAAALWSIMPLASVLLAAGLYATRLALPQATAFPLDLRGILQGAWVLMGLGGFILHFYLSLAETPDPQQPIRIRQAGWAGLTLALLLALLGTLNFIAARVNWQWNLAYFKISQPSEATLSLARSLDEDIEVALFFPQPNPVEERLHDYMDNLAAAGVKRLHIAHYDADLRPRSANDFKVRRNGSVVLRKGAVLKPIEIGERLPPSRTVLKQFDGRFLKALTELSRPRLRVYLSTGHGERTDEVPGMLDQKRGFERFTELLRSRNYEVLPLGFTGGLGTRIPDETYLLIVAAPVLPFQQAEIETIRRYLDGGGKMLVFLEPRATHDAAHRVTTPLEGLLAEYGIAYDPVIQANDRVFARRGYDANDHAFLVTNGYKRHPAVKRMNQEPNRFPFFMLEAGALRKENPPPNVLVRELFVGMAGTWADRNGNFVFDEKMESRARPILALTAAPRKKPAEDAASAIQPPRLLVFADADAATDLLLQNQANLVVISHTLNWLVGEAQPLGLPTEEKDVRIQHAKGDEWLWFYLPVAGIPGLVLLVGLIRSGAIRRRPIREEGDA